MHDICEIHITFTMTPEFIVYSLITIIIYIRNIILPLSFKCCLKIMLRQTIRFKLYIIIFSLKNKISFRNYFTYNLLQHILYRIFK